MVIGSQLVPENTIRLTCSWMGGRQRDNRRDLRQRPVGWTKGGEERVVNARSVTDPLLGCLLIPSATHSLVIWRSTGDVELCGCVDVLMRCTHLTIWIILSHLDRPDPGSDYAGRVARPSIPLLTTLQSPFQHPGYGTCCPPGTRGSNLQWVHASAAGLGAGGNPKFHTDRWRDSLVVLPPRAHLYASCMCWSRYNSLAHVWLFADPGKSKLTSSSGEWEGA